MWISSNPSRVFAVLACLALTVACVGTHAQEQSSRQITVDMPHGGCRLGVSQDGSASIAFGAMPRWVHVKGGVIDFAELKVALKTRSYPQRDFNAAKSHVGGLSLPGTQELLFIDDYDFVRWQLERAWSARVLPKTEREIEDDAWISKACALR